MQNPYAQQHRMAVYFSGTALILVFDLAFGDYVYLPLTRAT